jgi:hypothetical protein
MKTLKLIFTAIGIIIACIPIGVALLAAWVVVGDMELMPGEVI